MNKFKKALLSVLSLVLVAILSIGATLAYLKDEDSNVNVMTMGNVKIAQHEYERVMNEDGTYEMVTSEKYGEGYKLQEFTQAKPLYPATGSITGWGKAVYFDQLSTKASGGQKVFDGLENVQDKFVVVENTGKSDAYVRTLIAYEIGSLTEEKFNELIGTSVGHNWEWTNCGIVTISENNYFLVEALYVGNDSRHTNGVLPAGEYTYNSLAQVYMSNEATNEDVEAIDGNRNGLYDILVLSQAVQTKGFADAQTALDTAFGDITTINHPWVNYDFSNSVVTEEQLNEALKTNKYAKLESDIVLTDVVTTPFGTTTRLNLNGHKISIKDNGGVMLGFNSTLVIEGEGHINFDLYLIVNAFGDVIVKGGTYNEDPSIQLTIAEGYKVINNQDGTYTVVAE